MRIGITGVPGVGKSTFIDSFGTLLTNMGKKVAVLTIDPTSAQHKGSILGDKTRMPLLSKDPNAFIRPSPSGNALGGVANRTRENIILLEAAGYDVILIETVGVGQNEVAVHEMVDFFLLLKLAGAGDELQGIKRGIIEMADAIIINKADGANTKAAEIAVRDFSNALHLFPAKESGWTPRVLPCSAINNTGLDTIWQTVESFFKTVTANGYLQNNRKQQNKSWLLHFINIRLQDDFYTNPKIAKPLEDYMDQVQNGKLMPYVAAEELLKLYKQS